MDKLFASHAIALEVTLVTNEEADFVNYAGLRVENWVRHRLRLQKAVGLCRSEDHLRTTPIVHDDAQTATTIRLKRRP